jgi:uncharacterized iron-regulated membrane protein
MGFPSSVRVRALTKWLHIWGGIILGAVLSLTCLTGSVIVFRTEVDRAPLPHIRTTAGSAPRMRLTDAEHEIARLQPGARVTRIYLPQDASDPYLFQIRTADDQTRRVVIDPSSGKPVGELKKAAWMDWMIDLHRNVLVGKTGRKIVGGIGVLGVILGATGLLLWVIRGINWRSLVTIRKQPVRRFNFELHRVSGLWTLWYVLLLSLTGVVLAYPQTMRDAWQRVTGQPATVAIPKLDKTRGKPSKSLDDYLAIAHAAMPDGVPTELRIAEKAKDPVTVQFWRHGDLSSDGTNRVLVDPSSGKVLFIDRAADWPIGVRLFQSMQPLHYALFGGLTAKIIWSILGALPAVLFVTGLVVWWRPKKKKKQVSYSEQRQESDVALVS